MKVSVIIGAYNHLEDCTKPCCESIIRNTNFDGEKEIIIVGNGCKDGTKEYVESLGAPFIYLDFPEPIGYARANNEGIKIAKGDYFLLLNNDAVILDWGKDLWINMLIKAFDNNPRCGLAGPSMGYSGPADAKFLIFFCVMISRKCFEKVGYLDEEFKEGGGEDTAYCLEAKKLGFELLQVPPDSLWQQKDYMVGAYPIYHAGEKTVHGLSNWNEIFKRNSDILTKRYNRRWILSNNGERLVFGKGHQVDDLGVCRYSWARRNIYGSKILEIGCASGYGAQFLKGIPNLDYTGIDADSGIIEYGKENFGDIPGVKLQCADINTFDFEKYDTIIAFEVLEHLDNGKDVAQKLKDYCKRLLVSVPYLEPTAQINPYHKLRNLSESDFPGFTKLINFIPINEYKEKETDPNAYKTLGLKWTHPDVVETKTVTCVISTKDRSHTTLPMTIMGVCNQSVKPNHFIIYDDGAFKPDLGKDPLYEKLFATISASGISWEYKYGRRIGQVANHIQSVQDAPTEFIWRLDDDNIPDYNVLEGLLSCVEEDVGAVGGLVINDYSPIPALASNKIEDIYLGQNEQWYFHPSTVKPKEVDHLYSSFLYRKSIAEYPDNLSPMGHREETILTYEIKRKGYKVIFNPQVKTWHFSSPSGGIRMETKVQNVDHDNAIFNKKLQEWNVKTNDYSIVVLEHGLGDHFAFKGVLPQYFDTYKNKTHLFFVAYPEVFNDVPNIKLASVADAKKMFGGIEKYDLYKFIFHENFEKNLSVAYKKMYKLKGEVHKGMFGSNDVKDGTGNKIVISPWSFTHDHAKSYPYWAKLTDMLMAEGYEIIQIGRKGEEPIPSLSMNRQVMNFKFGLSFKELEELISSCRLWISVDNFLQHFVNSFNNPVKGVVIWAQSDPRLFGYHYNTNILKASKYLRTVQIAPWSEAKQIPESFSSPENVFEVVKKIIK